MGIYVAAIAIKGRVAHDEVHVETPGSGRVRAFYSIPAAAGKRARTPKGDDHQVQQQIPLGQRRTWPLAQQGLLGAGRAGNVLVR